MLRIKICGVTRPEDIAACADAGADMVGINFYPASHRYVEPRNAIALLRDVPAWISTVGVFVDRPMRQCCALAHQLGLRGIQGYGAEPEAVDPFPFSYIPSFRIRDESSLAAVDGFLSACAAFGYAPAAVLLDSHVAGAMGGTGHRAPWELIATWKRDRHIPVILAGGLTPENVAEAVRIVKPAAVDVASGVESAPGVKDADKIRDFVARARLNALLPDREIR